MYIFFFWYNTLIKKYKKKNQFLENFLKFIKRERTFKKLKKKQLQRNNFIQEVRTTNYVLKQNRRKIN